MCSSRRSLWHRTRCSKTTAATQAVAPSFLMAPPWVPSRGATSSTTRCSMTGLGVEPSALSMMP